MNAMMPDKTTPMPNSEQPKPFDKMEALLRAADQTKEQGNPDDLKAILDSMKEPNVCGGE